MSTITVLIAEDSTLLRRLLVQQIGREPGFAVVGEVADGGAAWETALRLRPLVVLMDLELPVMNGVEATRRIVEARCGSRVVLLTAHDDLASVGLMAGAVACLNKGCTPQELADTLRQVASLTKEVLRGTGDDNVRLPAALPPIAVIVEQIAQRVGLTATEQNVLTVLVETDQSGPQIAHTLSERWGRPVTEPSVRHALERVMTRMQTEPRTRATLVKQVLTEARLIPAAIGTQSQIPSLAGEDGIPCG